MSSKTVKTVAIVLLVVSAVAGAATVSYALQQRRIAQLSSQLEARDEMIESLSKRLDTLSSELASTAATTPDEQSQADQSDTDAQPAQDEPKPQTEPTVSRQFAFVRKATKSGGKVSLVLDFAEFLSGTAAAEAAAAAGDESPPPNDYYISNVNPKLRTFAVAKEAEFVIAGGDPTDTTTLSASQFYTLIKNNTNRAKEAPYWFTISNGVVTAGEEQWLP